VGGGRGDAAEVCKVGPRGGELGGRSGIEGGGRDVGPREKEEKIGSTGLAGASAAVEGEDQLGEAGGGEGGRECRWELDGATMSWSRTSRRRTTVK
jgi:hypothetical protein